MYMNDPTGPQLGYTPASYAFMMLRAPDDVTGETISDAGVRDVMIAAVHDFCPKHLDDLPASWHVSG